MQKIEQDSCPACGALPCDQVETPTMHAITIRPLIAWYDLWVGAFWDRKSRKLYILPVPCVGIVITFR